MTTVRPAGESHVLCWDDGARELRPGPVPGTDPAVGDSWLLADGRVRALERHFARFRGSVRALAGPRSPVDDFTRAARAALPRTGRWFPRIELHLVPAPVLALRLRSAPEPAGPARVCVVKGADPRTAPTVKGPDLSLLGGLREQAVRVGCDEALLVDRDDTVLEGAFTSLLWWRDGVLHAPPDDRPLLPGVTRALLLDLAGNEGVPVRRCSARLRELDGAELWLVNALHGVRPVAGVVAPGVVAGPAPLAALWQQRLVALAEPV